MGMFYVLMLIIGLIVCSPAIILVICIIAKDKHENKEKKEQKSIVTDNSNKPNTIISVDENSVNAYTREAKKEEKAKQIRTKQEKNSITMLIIGTIFIVLSSLILIGSNWNNFSNIVKMIVLIISDIALFGYSTFLDRIMKLKKPAKIVKNISLIFIPIICTIMYIWDIIPFSKIADLKDRAVIAQTYLIFCFILISTIYLRIYRKDNENILLCKLSYILKILIFSLLGSSIVTKLSDLNVKIDVFLNCGYIYLPLVYLLVKNTLDKDAKKELDIVKPIMLVATVIGAFLIIITAMIQSIGLILLENSYIKMCVYANATLLEILSISNIYLLTQKGKLEKLKPLVAITLLIYVLVDIYLIGISATTTFIYFFKILAFVFASIIINTLFIKNKNVVRALNFLVLLAMFSTIEFSKICQVDKIYKIIGVILIGLLNLFYILKDKGFVPYQYIMQIIIDWFVIDIFKLINLPLEILPIYFALNYIAIKILKANNKVDKGSVVTSLILFGICEAITAITYAKEAYWQLIYTILLSVVCIVQTLTTKKNNIWEICSEISLIPIMYCIYNCIFAKTNMPQIISSTILLQTILISSIVKTLVYEQKTRNNGKRYTSKDNIDNALEKIKETTYTIYETILTALGIIQMQSLNLELSYIPILSIGIFALLICLSMFRNVSKSNFNIRVLTYGILEYLILTPNTNEVLKCILTPVILITLMVFEYLNIRTDNKKALVPYAIISSIILFMYYATLRQHQEIYMKILASSTVGLYGLAQLKICNLEKENIYSMILKSSVIFSIATIISALVQNIGDRAHYAVMNIVWILIIYLIAKIITTNKNKKTINILRIIAYVLAFIVFMSISEVYRTIYSIELIIFILMGYFLKQNSLFKIAIIFTIINCFDLTKQFWYTIPWWIYLLFSGIILIGIATLNLYLQKQNITFKQFILNIINKTNIENERADDGK